MKIKIENKNVGERIKTARLKAKLTQAQLHDLTGISITQLSNYENGSRNIGIDNLSLIAKATNSTMDEIYFGSPSERPVISSSNVGELVVNCVTALFYEGVIGLLPHEEPNEFTYDQLQYSYRLAFKNHMYEIEDLIKKLYDFEENKEDYKEPDQFKKQLVDAIASRINKNIEEETKLKEHYKK